MAGGYTGPLLEALILKLEGEIAVAKANIEVYQKNAAGIGEPAPIEHAVRRVLPIGFHGMPHSNVATIGNPYGFGKKRSKKVQTQKGKASVKVSRRRRR